MAWRWAWRLVLMAARAIDINPSKNNQPPTFWESGGNHFSIFNGDPKRIQRANAVDPKSFDEKVDLSPNPLSLSAVKAAPANTALKVTFSVHNHAKKTYTLSFPTAQRWDFRILDPAGKPIYVYSDNCQFEQKVGTSMVNNDDKLVYMETVQFGDHKAQPPLRRAIMPCNACWRIIPRCTRRRR